MIDGKKIGLALSGGGYRAAAFHLGTLKKLHELKILDKVDVISTNSGGSIIGAFYAMHHRNFQEFEIKLKKGLATSVIRGIIYSPRFYLSLLVILSSFGIIVWQCTEQNFLVAVIIILLLVIALFVFQFFFFPITEIKEKVYDKIFFQNKKLSDLPDSPMLAINATNLETGRLWTYSRKKMSDSSYAYPQDGGQPIEFLPDRFPIAKAVASSTCVPFAFPPVRITEEYFKIKSDKERVSPVLVDGGVYDNQGIHKITQANSSYACDIIITSDAGNQLKKHSRYLNTFFLLVRISTIFMERIKNLQFIQNIYLNRDNDHRDISYFSLGWDYDQCIDGFIRNLKQENISEQVIREHQIPKEYYRDSFDANAIREHMQGKISYSDIISSADDKERIRLAKRVKTNLTALSTPQIESLIKHGSILTEIFVKLYCPMLTNQNSAS